MKCKHSNKCFIIFIKISVNSAIKKQVSNFTNEYNSATRNQTYLISMTENKLVELPNDSSKLQST